MSDRLISDARRTQKLIETRAARRTTRLGVRLGTFVLPEDEGFGDTSPMTDSVGMEHGHASPDEVKAYMSQKPAGGTTFGNLPGFAALRARLGGQPQD